MAQQNTNHKAVNTFNQLKGGLMKAGATAVTPNKLKVEYNGTTYHFLFKLPGSITLKQGVDTKGKFSINDTDSLKKVIALIQKIKGAYNPKQEQKTASHKPAPVEKTVTNKKASSSEPAKTQQKGNKMATHVNPKRITGLLTKKNWRKDKYGILENPVGITIRFTEKSVRLNNPENGLTLNIRSAVTTDQQFVDYLKVFLTGEKPTMKQTKGLTIPDGYADFFQKQAQAEEKAKNEQAKAEAAKKPAPIMPENPAGDKAPVFDALNKAISTTAEAEKMEAGAWAGIASQFDYSVANLTKSLHAEGKWPNKLKKDGSPATYEDENGKVYFTPAGYQSVYKAERENGIKGVGHMVNTAAAKFTKYNPATAERLEKARVEAEKKRQEQQSQQNRSNATTEEKEVGKIFDAMSNLAKKLTAQDLKTWLESDSSVTSLWEEMASGNFKEDNPELAELADEEIIDPELTDAAEEEIIDPELTDAAEEDELLAGL